MAGPSDSDRSIAARTSPVRVRLLLAKFWDEDETPTIVSAVDQSVWEHWEQADEDRWRSDGQRSWGLDPSDCEWREVWADLDPAALRAAFQTPVVEGVIADAAE